MNKATLTPSLTLTHSYKYYIKDIGALSRYNIDVKLYKQIINTFNELLISHLVEDGDWIDLPYRLGQLRIRKRKVNLEKLKCDFGLYQKTGIKARHLNEHTGEYYCRFYWNKSRCIVTNKSYYTFIPTRTNKRRLATCLKTMGQFIPYLD